MGIELDSWNDTEPKAKIAAFVASICDKQSPDFLPPSERIAVFDNDGTLWSEQPFYFQGLFLFDRVRELVAEHPEWHKFQPFKSVLERDWHTLGQLGVKALLELAMATHGGMTTIEFEHIAKDWLAKARHPQLGRPFTKLIFQPMVELLNYLRAHEFKTYIVSGGGIEFVRTFSEHAYGIPPEQIIRIQNNY